ncbi:MAG: hypothetical protein P0119_04895 [Nitrospira sp.]|nr:hypothetical protein [Nitrospira sp.]
MFTVSVDPVRHVTQRLVDQELRTSRLYGRPVEDEGYVELAGYVERLKLERIRMTGA